MYKRAIFIKIVSEYLFAISLLAQIFCGQTSAPEDLIDGRIVGGTPADIGDLPYLMQIWLEYQFICGGSLVKINFILSAAHCYKNVTTELLTAVGGATKLSDHGVRRKVHKIMMHPKYDSPKFAYDIAVLKLTEPMFGTNIAVIPLNKEPLFAGVTGQVSGWGKTRETSSVVSIELRTINIRIVPKSMCSKQYEKYVQITNTMFCAASQVDRKDSCSGDSGGPFACRGKLCGIVSWGFGCARPNFPGVYTDIRVLLPYIVKCFQQ